MKKTVIILIAFVCLAVQSSFAAGVVGSSSGSSSGSGSTTGHGHHAAHHHHAGKHHRK